MRFRVRFQDPNRDTENLIECDTIDEAHVAHNAIRRYAAYLGTVHLPICSIEYRPSGVYSERDWRPIPVEDTTNAVQDFIRGLTAHLN